MKHGNRYLFIFALYVYLFLDSFLQLDGGQLIFYLFFGMLDHLCYKLSAAKYRYQQSCAFQYPGQLHDAMSREPARLRELRRGGQASSLGPRGISAPLLCPCCLSLFSFYLSYPSPTCSFFLFSINHFVQFVPHFQ